MRNEIIKQNETVIMKGDGTTMSYGFNGMYALLIQPFSSPRLDILDGRHIEIQTWEIRLNSGEATLARMITWLD